MKEWIVKVTPKSMMLRGSCTLCGDCCRDMMIYDGKKFIRTEEDFSELVKSDSYYSMFEISKQEGFNLWFTCSNLLEDNTCKIHDTRPQVCRDYPDKDMLYHGTGLPAQCGYKYIGPVKSIPELQ